MTLSQKGIVSDLDNLSITIYYNDNGSRVFSSSEIDNNNADFPFGISPSAEFNGRWYRRSPQGNKASFIAKLKSPLKLNTLYKITFKEWMRQEWMRPAVKDFSFQTTAGWEERKQFVIPVELELPEEILPVIKNIKVSLLME